MNVSYAHTSPAPASQASAAIEALDLSTVRIRLMHPHAGLGWSEARTLAAENDYRAFLLFARTCPSATPSPTRDVDSFWHFHILDTLKYAQDCAMAFGYFLHHQPEVEFAEDDAEHGANAQAARTGAYCARVDLTAAQAKTARQDAYCALTRPVLWHAAPARSAMPC